MTGGADQFEHLGAFYLGRRHDQATGQTSPDPVLYDARDLTTHAVCVGMTGSGKTGLCLALLEEAALDGIPAIAIDPKGDIGNLLLTFPGLTPQEFLPWVDEGEAKRKGLTTEAFAAAQADLWRKGLSDWGQDGARIARLREAADLAIYTPGSESGRPLAVLRSLEAPTGPLAEDAEAVRDRVMGVVSGLLALVGLSADPVKSREHILLSTIIAAEWAAGRGVGLERLIGLVQEPPFTAVGVVGLDAFMPPKDRSALAMALNNLLASPGFAAWRQGEAMDIARLLHTPEGKPRVSVLSIAHLSEPQRMFFVTLLLNEVVAWMRTQPGTGSLRAIVYMDEVFGYFPPTAEPPSKRPLLTMMKQARAYGVGVVLATQNPVDLDYKGLSNAGTWLLGRLQTEGDKRRVLDGLEGAGAAGFDKAAMERTLAGLGSRVFLMHNVHEDGPVVFKTRWAMSYLRGPLTREQVRRLCVRPETAPAEGPQNGAESVQGPSVAAASAPAAPRPATAAPPLTGAGFVPVTRAVRDGESLVYRPCVLGLAPLHYVRAGQGVDLWRDARLLAPLGEAPAWEEAIALDAEHAQLGQTPDPRGAFDDLPAGASLERAAAGWKRGLIDHLYRHAPLRVLHCPGLKLRSEPGEAEGAFAVRVREAAHERRDEAIDALRAKYASKVGTLQERLRAAEQRVEVERSQARTSGLEAAASFGATVLGAILGRKAVSATNVRRAGTAAGRASRTAKERADVERALETVGALRAKLADLEAQAAGEIERVRAEHEPSAFAVESVVIPPRKTDMGPATAALAWAPYRVAPTGRAEPAFAVEAAPEPAGAPGR